jgi:hypothetical protein
MSEAIALELPETLAKKVKEIATLNHRSIEEMLIELINRAINDVPVDSLPNEQILALCNLQMSAQQQKTFSDLQARNQEEQLNEQEIKSTKRVNAYLSQWTSAQSTSN